MGPECQLRALLWSHSWGCQKAAPRPHRSADPCFLITVPVSLSIRHCCAPHRQLGYRIFVHRCQGQLDSSLARVVTEAGVGAGGCYLWPWALVFMWSRILMACLSRPSTLWKYTLLSTRLFTALQAYSTV